MSSLIDDLFVFPTVMIDGQNEEKKVTERERLGLPKKEEENEEYDIIYGEAEYPYYDFAGIEDRWVPNKEGFEKALAGRFNACLVKFSGIGHLLVPWTKKKFKVELAKFTEEREKTKGDAPERAPKTTIIKFTPEMIEEILKKSEDKDEKGEG